MFKNINLILVALSSYVLSLPVVCNTLMTNEIRVAQAVEGEANVLDELLEVPEFREAYLNGDYDADPGVDEFDVLYAVENGYDGSSPYSLYLYVWNKSGNGSDVYNFSDNYNSISIYHVNKGQNLNYDIYFVNKSGDNRFLKYKFIITDFNKFFNEDTGSREYGITGIQIGKYVNGLTRYIDYKIAKKWNFRDNDSQKIITYYDTFNVLDDIHLNGGAFNFGDDKEPVQCADGTYTDGLLNQHLYYVYFNVPKVSVENNDLFSVRAEYYDFDFSDKLIGFYSGFDKASVDNDWGTGSPAYLVGYGYSPGTMGGINVRYVHRYSSLEDNYPIIVQLNGLNDLVQNISGHLVSELIDRNQAYRITGQSKQDTYNLIHFCNQSRDDSDAVEKNFDLISAGSQNSSFWNWLTGIKDTTYIEDLNCIEKIDPIDVDLDDSSFSNKYYVNNNDISNIKELIDSEVDTYVFRFKIDKSITMPICYSRADGFTNNFYRQDCGILAYEYHGVVDFDVLDLTFVDGENVLHNYPVVSSPVNVFPDVVTPYSFVKNGCGGFWKTLLMILMVLVLVILVLLFLKWFIPWRRNRQVVNAVKSSGKSSSKNNSVNHYTYNIKKTYINKSSRKKRKKRRK